jgi:hypothetical protein
VVGGTWRKSDHGLSTNGTGVTRRKNLLSSCVRGGGAYVPHAWTRWTRDCCAVVCNAGARLRSDARSNGRRRIDVRSWSQEDFCFRPEAEVRDFEKADIRVARNSLSAVATIGLVILTAGETDFVLPMTYAPAPLSVLTRMSGRRRSITCCASEHVNGGALNG